MPQSFQTALALHQQGQLDEAERHYRAVLEAEPDHFNALNNLAMLLFRAEKLEEALALTRKAAALDPRNVETLGNLAEMLARSGDSAQAISTFENALTLEPANARTLHRFVRVLRARNAGDVRGLGIGMAYVKASLRKMSGSIWFESALGVGTTFYVSLPKKPLRTEAETPDLEEADA